LSGHAYVPKDAQPDSSTTDTSVESEIEAIEKEDLPSQPPPPEERRKEGESEPDGVCRCFLVNINHSTLK